MKILQVNSSARAEVLHSTRLASTIAERLCAANPGSTLTVRDLARTPHPALDESALGARFTAPSCAHPDHRPASRWTMHSSAKSRLPTLS